MNRLILLPSIAISALLLAQLPFFVNLGLSALPLAIVLGMLFGQWPSASITTVEMSFTRFCQQKLLRTGMVLFGFSLTFQQLFAVGWQSLLLDAIVISVIFTVGTLVGIYAFKLSRDVAILTSAGSAICGAAAILATESVLKPRQQDVTVAIASVVLFGTLAMFAYPLIYPHSGMDEHAFGIYIGSTVHEVAQAVAAGASVSEATLQQAVVVKLMRVMLLAPFIVLLGRVLQRDRKNTGPLPFPWFVLGFVACAAIASVVQIPASLLQILHVSSQFCLALAMSALGVQTRFSTLRQAGVRPLLLALVLFVLLLLGGYYLNLWVVGL